MTTSTTPIQFRSRNPVSGYPLTEGELSVLAEQWWDVYYDLAIWITLSGSYGGAESGDKYYALDRLDLLAGILGDDEIERIRSEVEERWKEKIDETWWAAFKEGRALWQEETDKEEEGE